MNPIPNIEKWQEILRLFHKFHPRSKSIIRNYKDLNMDKVAEFITHIDETSKRHIIDTSKDSLETFKLYFGKHIEDEKDRILVIPDLSYYEKKPFICSAKTLLERIEEGIELNGTQWELIDGCSDVLFIFETTKKLLLFDHHEGVTLAIPTK